jgi:hypothetical protein
MADWPPLKNSAFTVTFPIYDADGDLVTGATSPDSEVSKDGGTFTDVSPGEASEIATSSGVYTLALSATEMNADIVATITKSGTGKTAVNVMYTVARQLADLAYPATSGRSIQVETDGMVHGDLKEWLGVAPAALSSQRVQSEVGAMLANVLNAAAINADAITAAKVAADVHAEAADAVWDELRSGHVGVGSFGEGVASIQGNVTGSVGSVTGAVGSVTGAVGSVGAGGIVAATFGAGAINAAAIADGAIDAATFAADAIDAAAIASGAIVAATFAAGAVNASALAADAANKIADEVLSVDVGDVEATMPLHSLGTAVLKAVSRIVDDAGTLKLYRTNGTTLHMSQTITVNASADPIDELTVGV